MELTAQLGQRLVGVGVGPTWVLVFPLVVTAIVMGLLGVLGRAGRIEPNEVFGIRTKRAKENPSEWYRIHREAAPWALGGVVVSIGGIVAVFLVPRGTPQVVVLPVTMALAVALLVVGTVSASRRGGSAVDHDGS
ncbi:SdpI family protein [Saccharomonospora glauca]|jgi:uncharacterized membrane protein|uniref:SdpI/YhfL protein family n=1 Tax=Saccharomonospora glauca K62 TaxID=928724 RepID=I1D6A4_9PSEU|nr:SdpI family protein [Saccharomonospora glauca]EIF00479.1 hypothetical protein SacglDRAFT_03623 [Saccharomonospora glauca K62]